jgi:dGTPase
MRDRDRVLHSTAFRRLMHKTQVYIGPPNDHQRTRLTHTLEVSQLARTAARALRLNEDLTEAIALVHDIGHPPFGHAGERALNALLAEHGGFEHNRHALRRVELLEERYPQFPGLNLSYEVLEALAYRSHDLSHADVAEFATPLRAPAEYQVVDQCDSIAYDAHDVDDALRVGLLTLDDLRSLELWREAEEAVQSSSDSPLGEKQLARSAIRWVIDCLVTNLLEVASVRLAATPSPEAVRLAPHPVLALDEPRMVQKRELESFLFNRVYRNPDVVRATDDAEQTIRDLFERYMSKPSLLPDAQRVRTSCEPPFAVVRDYIAGMTDRFAQRVHRELILPNSR